MEQGSVIKIRPASMELGVPSFRPTIRSSPSNIFVQEVLAQTYSTERMVYNFRSPGQHLLCSPLMFGIFRIKITCPYKLNKASQIGPLVGVYDTNTAALGQATSDAKPLAIAAGGFHSREGYGYRPLFAFGEGNCPMRACESKSISVNGSTWTELGSNLYYRSLQRCFVPPDQLQRSCSSCGGVGNKSDSTPISGHVLGLLDSVGYSGQDHAVGGLTTRSSVLVARTATANTYAELNTSGFRPTEGATMDSGLRSRMENFYNQIVKVEDDPAAAINGKVYTLEIKFPIEGSVFNSQWGGATFES